MNSVAALPARGKWDSPEAGRDHHPRCFTIWMAGGGVKPGTTYGATDDFSYNVAENPVHVQDLHATALHLLGIDHERFSFRFQASTTSSPEWSHRALFPKFSRDCYSWK